MRLPFDITVYSKQLQPQGKVGGARQSTFDPRWNALGVGAFSVTAKDRVRQFLEEPGARVTVRYRDEHLMSGPIRKIAGDFKPNGLITYSIEDDWRELTNTLGWVAPNAGTYTSGRLSPSSLTDDAQSVSTAAHAAGTASGSGYYVFPAALSSAESLIKNLLSMNFTRLGRNVRVLPDLQRGGNARSAGMVPQVRFDTLEEAIGELLAWSGLTLRVWHDGGPTLLADVFQPTVRPQPLTPESGIVKSGKWSISGPRATRTVMGGPGEDNARDFYGLNDATGLEAEWGDIIEVFRDATGATLTWPDAVAEALRVSKYFRLRPEASATDKAVYEAYLVKAGRTGLAEGRPTSGLSVELAETRAFHFHGADGVHLGDSVRVAGQGQVFDAPVTAAALKFDGSAFTVTPQLGERTDDPNAQLAQAIRRLMAGSRRRATSQ